MINLLPFAPSFERNNSQVPLKKQKVLIASRPSHSLVLTQAWDDRPANRHISNKRQSIGFKKSFFVHVQVVNLLLFREAGRFVPAYVEAASFLLHLDCFLFWHSLCL